MFGTIGKSMLAVAGTAVAATLGIAVTADAYGEGKRAAKKTGAWVASAFTKEEAEPTRRVQKKRTARKSSPAKRRSPAAPMPKKIHKVA